MTLSHSTRAINCGTSNRDQFLALRKGPLPGTYVAAVREPELCWLLDRGLSQTHTAVRHAPHSCTTGYTAVRQALHSCTTGYTAVRQATQLYDRRYTAVRHVRRRTTAVHNVLTF